MFTRHSGPQIAENGVPRRTNSIGRQSTRNASFAVAALTLVAIIFAGTSPAMASNSDATTPSDYEIAQASMAGTYVSLEEGGVTFDYGTAVGNGLDETYGLEFAHGIVAGGGGFSELASSRSLPPCASPPFPLHPAAVETGTRPTGGAIRSRLIRAIPMC